MKILIIGDKRHGKDTVGEMIEQTFGLKAGGSSIVALETFLLSVLEQKYLMFYDSIEDAYQDRVNHRAIWCKEISFYNRNDKAKLAKKVLEDNDMYIGMRDHSELDHCIDIKLFDYIIGVYDPRKEREGKDSNTIDVFKYSDFLILNNKGLEELRWKVENLPFFRKSL